MMISSMEEVKPVVIDPPAIAVLSSREPKQPITLALMFFEFWHDGRPYLVAADRQVSVGFEYSNYQLGERYVKKFGLVRDIDYFVFTGERLKQVMRWLDLPSNSIRTKNELDEKYHYMLTPHAIRVLGIYNHDLGKKNVENMTPNLKNDKFVWYMDQVVLQDPKFINSLSSRGPEPYVLNFDAPAVVSPKVATNGHSEAVEAPEPDQDNFIPANYDIDFDGPAVMTETYPVGTTEYTPFTPEQVKTLKDLLDFIASRR